MSSETAPPLPPAPSSSSSGGVARRRPTPLAPGMLLATLLMTVPAALPGQASLLDLRLLELDRDGRRTYHNLIYSRGLGESRFSFEAFWLFLPPLDDYDEVGAGVGYRWFERGQVSVALLAYLASAPDDDYLEPAVLVTDTSGRLTGSLFVLRYVPLGRDGIEQWLVDPAEIQWRVGGTVSLGVSAYLYRPRGGSWLRKIGPKLSLADPLGATEVAVRDVNQGGDFEIQLRRIFAF